MPKSSFNNALDALTGTLEIKKNELMARLKPYISDYGQIVEKGSPINNQYQQLKRNISQHIPRNEDFRSPQAMSEWSQKAALNAPMGLSTMTTSQLNSVLKRLRKENPSTLPKIPSGNVFNNNVSEVPMEARLAADDYFNNNYSLSDVNVNDIYPTQRNINIDNLKSINNINEPPRLINIDGKYYIQDGHHRVSRDIISGDRSVSANVFNYGNKLNK